MSGVVDYSARGPQARYASHAWVGHRQDIPGQPTEYVTTCAECGIEDRGDPAEFDDLDYPDCSEVDPE